MTMSQLEYATAQLQQNDLAAYNQVRAQMMAERHRSPPPIELANRLGMDTHSVAGQLAVSLTIVAAVGAFAAVMLASIA